MGNVHEKTALESRVPGSHKRLGCGPTNHRYSKWCIGRGEAASNVCSDVGAFPRGSISSSESCLDSTSGEKSAGGIREGYSDTSGTKSIHSQEMGRGNSKKTGWQKMKTLVVAQQKGGVGKTSTLVHIAYDFFERGLKVAVIDLDTQGNASFTLKEYESGYLASQMFEESTKEFHSVFSQLPDGPLLSLIKSDPILANMESRPVADVVANFKAKIAALSDCGFDVVLIDTAPSLGVSLATALYASDYVVSPIELEAYSIQGIGKMVTTIINVRQFNPSLNFLGMVPSKVDGRNPRHGQHLAELKEAYPQLMIPAAIGLRSSIADALATGVPVWKIKKTAARKAAKEVRELAKYIFEKMEIAE